jgi:hypothetical protein
MARSLAGKIFYSYVNNGVDTIVSEDVLQALNRFRQIGDDITKELRHDLRPEVRTKIAEAMVHLCVPIFTFVRKSRLEKDPVYTGDRRLLDALTEYIGAQGGRVEQESYYVPFSSGPEDHDYRYVTSDKQFFDTFGVSIEKLKSPDLGDGE